MGLVSLLFSFNGRIKRSQYWLGTIAVNMVNWMVLFMTTSANLAAAQAKDPAAQLSALASNSALMLPVSLAVTWAALAIQVKRFHDRGQSGWWTLLPLAPIVFIIMNVFTAIGEGWPIERLFSSLGMPLLAFVVICIGFFINLGCLPGTDGPNKFGDPPGAPPSARFDPAAPSGRPQPQAAFSLGGADAAMERAIAEKSRVAPAVVKTARPATAGGPAPATAGAPAGFGRRPAR
ncbi:MAG TPA: DUF805 domain-containing protein [Candidatus Binatia bacterium]|nr:DUF805 domain-containing protein [Candidatus Binatia bacterium]